MEKAWKLADYSFQTAKSIDAEVRNLATKALRLPQSLKYLEEQSEENKRLAFSQGTVEKISQVRFEAAVIQRATNIWDDLVFTSTAHTKRRKLNHQYIYRQRHRFKIRKKLGGTNSIYLQDLALQIQELINQFNLKIHFQHIPGVTNIQADRLSRRTPPLYEWKLPTKWLQLIQSKWGQCTIDAFVARNNNLLPKIWSLHPDPAATAVDAFQQIWPRQGLYLQPPWKLIPKVLHMFNRQKVQDIILMTPYWKTQFWYPMILTLTKEPPLIIPINKKWNLTAWKLSRPSIRKTV